MKINKKLKISVSLALLLLFLTGCVQTNSKGEPTGEGVIYNLLVRPMSATVHYFAHNLNWGYGFAIIAITIIVRILILPLALNSSKKMMIQQQKMAKIQPEMQRIQERLKNAQTDQERMQLNMAMQQLMSSNGISMMGGMGCLPLLIQMPIFTALFYAAKYTPGINQASFLGIDLGHPNFILTLLAAGCYLLQGYLSTLSVPKEQRKQMQMTMLMSPIMIFFVSVSSPAGVTLYWVIGGLISCLQVLITNFYHKPKIERELNEYFEKHPIKTHIDIDKIKVPTQEEQREKHPVTPREDDIINQSKKRRNEGKQHRH